MKENNKTRYSIGTKTTAKLGHNIYFILFYYRFSYFYKVSEHVFRQCLKIQRLHRSSLSSCQKKKCSHSLLASVHVRILVLIIFIQWFAWCCRVSEGHKSTPLEYITRFDVIYFVHSKLLRVWCQVGARWSLKMRPVERVLYYYVRVRMR